MLTEVLITVIVLFVTWNYFSRPKDFPPGPWGFPIIGHFPLLGTSPHKKLLAWKKTWGKLIGINFGSFRTVVINDAKLIREALGNPAFSGRPPMKPMAYRSGGVPKGIIFTEGSHWTEQRRFALHNMRDLGFGRKSMEGKVLDEVTELCLRFKEQVGSPMPIRNTFNAAVLNSLWGIITGERFKQDDPQLQEAVHRLTSSIANNNILASLSVFIPWTADWFPTLSGFNSVVKEFPHVIGFVRSNIEKHNESYVQNEPRDFIDLYMDEVKKTTSRDSSFHEAQDTMLFTVLDLFVAGAETTSTTMTWMFAYMIHFPEVQEKLYGEIMQVVGDTRLPSLSDRPKMAYTEAVINETLRHCALVPFAVFHSATSNVEFHGYQIPKDTLIVPNLYAAHHDPEIWGDPEKFRPERFLDSDKKLKKNDNFMPFAVGKRFCLGESLARDELFLFTTCIFQKFKVCQADKLPDLEGTVSSIISPKPFEVVLKERKPGD